MSWAGTSHFRGQGVHRNWSANRRRAARSGGGGGRGGGAAHAHPEGLRGKEIGMFYARRGAARKQLIDKKEVHVRTIRLI